MDIILYRNHSPENKINKEINNATTFQCTLKGGSDVLNPTIELSTTSSIVGFNYMQIPYLNRYYYITSIENIRNNLWRVNGRVDVLNTYANEILAQSAIIDKQENRENTNTYYDDGSWVTLNKTFNQIINFPGGFNDNGEFILITAGG